MRTKDTWSHNVSVIKVKYVEKKSRVRCLSTELTGLVAEERDFPCHSHVTNNLGERSIPSDHVAVRVVIQRPQDHSSAGTGVPQWMSNHSVFCRILKQSNDDHTCPREAFAALADFINKSLKRRESSRGMNYYAMHQPEKERNC